MAGEGERMLEEELIRDYFNKGFKYDEIREFLDKNHSIAMSIATLKRRVKAYGLKRKNPDYDIQVVRAKITSILDGPGCIGGYRHVWHTLQMQGITVPRNIVQNILKELDPEGTAERRAHKLKRRTYHNHGPNDVWHCDGYDKLKPFGFPIHGCIDGWSRKILWLYITRSNNSPHNIATYYLDAVQHFGGCPQKLVTDLGTENGIMASIHSFFRDNINGHRYVPSPRNQRIESWWSYFRRSRSNWWINFFKDLEERGTFNRASELESECLWFCFAPLLQADIDQLKEHWNTHYIRKSRHDTVSGRPDSLYFLPESNGGVPNLLLPVPDHEMQYARLHIVDNVEQNNFQEYFHYLMSTCALTTPENWRDGLNLYHTLLDYANNGL